MIVARTEMLTESSLFCLTRHRTQRFILATTHKTYKCNVMNIKTCKQKEGPGSVEEKKAVS
jgi:hypothetical protein